VSAAPVVVDTNTAVIANGSDEPSRACVRNCAAALASLVASGVAVVDADRKIVREYLQNLDPKRQPGVGHAFVKWLLSNLGNRARVHQVKFHAEDERCHSIVELGDRFAYVDPSDRKFVAVALLHPARPTILEAFDSKWWGWRARLSAAGVDVTFVCEAEIAAKHGEKLGPKARSLR
jgi:hypothetical protein